MSVKNGFTLIELSISIGLLAAILVLTSGILVGSTKTHNKQAALQEVERNGDYVIRIIEDNVRKANNVYVDASNYLVVDMPDPANPINNLRKFYGYVPNSNPAICSGNYMFNTETDLSQRFAESSRLTKDTDSGVRVTGFSAQIFTGAPTQVFVKIDLQSCADTNVRRSFQTFITARGTYK